MRIKKVQITITTEEVEKALSTALENSNRLGAFNKVKIESVDSESGLYVLDLSYKGARSVRNNNLDENTEIASKDDDSQSTEEDIKTPSNDENSILGEIKD